MTALQFGDRSLAVAALLLTFAACGNDGHAGEHAGTGGTGGTSATPRGQPSEPVGPCNTVTQSFDVPSAQHVSDCSSLPQGSNPPSGGDHYGTWAAFQSYPFPVPHGFLIHDMEHGAVIVYYDCPNGCVSEVAQVQAWLDARPEDPLCVGRATLRRAVLIPDPSLGVRFAMSAWGETLRADCFDSSTFTSFYAAHYGHGPEQLCNEGVAFDGPPCE